MGLMDKFKNLFTDEEVVEDDEEEKVEIKEVKKEEKSKLPTFMREKIEKEENEPKVMSVEENLEIKKEIKLEDNIEEETAPEPPEEKTTFKFPIEFNENDFTDTRTSRQDFHAKEREINTGIENITQFYEEEEPVLKKPKQELKVSDLYKDKKEEVKAKEKRFKATPIISPIYGILDKNYDPTEVENNRGHNLEDTRPSKSLDFDSVRKKAYGNLTDEIKENLLCENCEYLKEAKDCKKRKSKTHEEEIEEYTEDIYSDNDDITMDEAAENYFDYGVEYKKKAPAKHREQENYYLDDDAEEEVKIVDHNEEEQPKTKKEIPPVKSSINLLSTLKKNAGDEVEPEEQPTGKNLELTDDLFNLIDSMYDERNDDK